MPGPVVVCRSCQRDIWWDQDTGGWRHIESHSLLCPDGSRAVISTEPSRRRTPSSATVSQLGETIVETGAGHLIIVAAAGERVSVDWCGPRHADFTLEVARTLGYVLRAYARLIGPSVESDE